MYCDQDTRSQADLRTEVRSPLQASSALCNSALLQVVALTTGAVPGGFCSPILAGKSQHLSGLPLWAMLSCAASERPDLAWVGIDSSLARPWASHAPYAEKHDASGFFDSHAKAGRLTSAPVLVPCHLNNGQEQHLGQV